MKFSEYVKVVCITISMTCGFGLMYMSLCAPEAVKEMAIIGPIFIIVIFIGGFALAFNAILNLKKYFKF